MNSAFESEHQWSTLSLAGRAAVGAGRLPAPAPRHRRGQALHAEAVRAQGLLDAGMPHDIPAVAVQDGTTPTQRVVQAPLDGLADEVVREELRSPTLIIIGHVVSLLEQRGCAPGEIVSNFDASQAVSSDEVLEILARVEA